VRRLFPWIVLLAGCAPDLEPAGAPAGPIQGTLAWRPDTLLPWRGEPTEELPFQRTGRTPSTRLYLGFDGSLSEELALQGARTEAEPRRVAGRHRAGVEVRERFRIALAPGGGPGWTLDCWIRPADDAPGGLLALRGLVAARRDAAGHVVVQAPPGPAGDVPPTQVRSEEPLPAGRWSHLAIAVDLEATHGLRLVLNGKARGRPLAADLEPPEALEVVLGPEEAGEGVFGLDDLRVQARAANTEEFLIHREKPRAAETLVRVRDGVAESEEVWFGMQRGASLRGEADWRRGLLERVVADASGLRRVDGHWRRIDAVDPPPARTTHGTAFLGKHRILVFGGETRDSHCAPMHNTADTWIFDTRAETWTRLDLPDAPAPRCHQPLVFSPDHGVALLAGGFRIEDRPVEVYGDAWLFHADRGTWELGAPADGPGFSDDAVVYHPGQRVFVFLNGRSVRTFDPKRRAWKRLPAARVEDEWGRKMDLDPAGSMMAEIDPATGLVLLFGGTYDGTDDERFVADTYLYDLERNCLTRIERRDHPAPRVRGGLGWDPVAERFVLFGGVRSQGSLRLADLWSFDPTDRIWLPLEADEGPGPRGGYYGMQYDPELQRFFLLCGREDRTRFLSEAWTLALDARAPGRARYVFDRAETPEAARWFAETETPDGTRVTFRFRSSPDARTWSAWAGEPSDETRYLQVEVALYPGTRGESPRVRGLGFRVPDGASGSL